jgi:hypothetical protein
VPGGGPIAIPLALTALFGGVAAGLVAGLIPASSAALLVGVAVGTVVGTQLLLSWRSVVATTIVVILFIPIRRYALPGHLPFELEPYRLLIAVVGAGWLGSLLVDPRVRLRRSAIDTPLAMVVFVSAGSIVLNADRLSQLNVTDIAIKQLTFLLTFVLIFYLVVSVVRTYAQLDFVLGVLVACGCVVAVFALVELWTGLNVFNHLDRVFPFLTKTSETGPLARSGRLRVFGSAQHPIALGSMLVLLIPIAIYLAVSSRHKRWIAAIPVLGLAVLATVSRTGILSLLVIAVMYVILRPKQTVRLWPLLLPALVAIHVLMPGMLGGIYKNFFPKEGLIAQQDGTVGSSRVASFGPAMEEVELRPLLGGGYGSRIPLGPGQNSFIVDDQWLSTAMEIGLLGVFAWAWLFVRFIRRMMRASREEDGDRGWLYAGLACSTAAFAVGMATYDAFSFIQVTFVLFILLAIGCAALSFREPRTL